MQQVPATTLTATGQVAFPAPGKNVNDTEVIIAISGNFTGCSGKVEASYDGTNWAGVQSKRLDTGAVVNGGVVIALTDATPLLLSVSGVQGLPNVRFNCTIYGALNLTIALQSQAFVGIGNTIITESITGVGVFTALTVTGNFVESAQDGITAFATGGQGSAVQLTALNSRVAVCATTGDSVKLMASVTGLTVTVANAGAASCNVFPAVGEAINAGAANAAFAVAAGKTASFTCYAVGRWHSILSA
jgi:hypothetical protein